MANLEGQTLANNFFLRKAVGSGGMATVFLAWDREKSTEMAVKVLKPEYTTDSKVMNLFISEAKILKRINHPNIVRYYGYKEEGNIVFIVLDWIDGQNLRELIRSSRVKLSMDDAVKIMRPITAALRYAHTTHKVFHCDIKPANILVHRDGRVFLTDFGMARIAQQKIGGGTLPYMAPEQFNGGRVDARTDVYGLGVTLFEMLSGGELPFRGDSPESKGTTEKERIMYEHNFLPVPSIRHFNRNVPSGVEHVISTALNKNPKDRFSDTTAFRDALEQVNTSPGGPTNFAQTFIETTFENKFNIRKDSSRPGSKDDSHRRKKPAKMRNPHLQAVGGPYSGKNLPIIQGGLRIGRSSKNDVRVPDRSVSRFHAVLWTDGRNAYIRDEESGFGTLVNGKPIQGIHTLSPGDKIQIGPSQVFVFKA